MSTPFCQLGVDCRSVVLGTRRDLAWTRAPTRRYARAWGPLAAALHEDASRVAWMPSRCLRGGTGARTLDDGSPVTDDLIVGNDAADRLARQAAEADRVPAEQRHVLRQLGSRIAAPAKWLGRVTAFANAVPLPALAGGKARDAFSAPRTAGTRGGCKRKDPPAAPPAVAGGDFWASPRRAVLRQKVIEREQRSSTATRACPATP